MPTPLPTRLPLSGRNPRRLSFERRLRLWLLALIAPIVVLASLLIEQRTGSRLFALTALVALALVGLIAAVALFDQITRPLQTLSNVVAALREDDFSFRARGAQRGDSLGDLALEINALAGMLQGQRSSALDALTLVERVLTSMPSPVLAFDPQSHLRLLNPAAARAFRLPEREALGQFAPDLHLGALLDLPDQGVFNPHPPVDLPDAASTPQQTLRWSVRRTTFRLHGIPHTLFVLTDVSSALREEERLAWQRLIRVLGHEINNSLTPIKSIAGSLRSRLPPLTQPIPGASGASSPDTQPELHRGLAIIEDRADSLNRFLQAYQRLSRLPAPVLRPTMLAPLAQQVASLETRLPIRILPSPDLVLLADPDQLQQLLINLLRNAVDAALTPPAPPTPPLEHSLARRRSDAASFVRLHAGVASHRPQVDLVWTITDSVAVLHIVDNGPGLTNAANLFVPFYTTKPGGSGIGLVLAQQIASAHHGSLTLANRSGHTGCQAEIRLPLASASLPDPLTRPPSVGHRT